MRTYAGASGFIIVLVYYLLSLVLLRRFEHVFQGITSRRTLKWLTHFVCQTYARYFRLFWSRHFSTLFTSSLAFYLFFSLQLIKYSIFRLVLFWHRGVLLSFQVPFVNTVFFVRFHLHCVFRNPKGQGALSFGLTLLPHFLKSILNPLNDFIDIAFFEHPPQLLIILQSLKLHPQQFELLDDHSC